MSPSDDLVRAQARALIRVLQYYGLDRGSADAIWRDVQTFGSDLDTLMDLRTIGRKHAGAAAAAFRGGVILRAPNAALFLALSSFTRASAAYRFLDSSRWIALCFAFMDRRAVAEAAVQTEVLERLEAELAGSGRSVSEPEGTACRSSGRGGQADRGQSFPATGSPLTASNVFGGRCPVENPTLLAGSETVTRHSCDAISERW
jgi:hypothetical protein